MAACLEQCWLEWMPLEGNPRAMRALEEESASTLASQWSQNSTGNWVPEFETEQVIMRWHSKKMRYRTDEWQWACRHRQRPVRTGSLAPCSQTEGRRRDFKQMALCWRIGVADYILHYLSSCGISTFCLHLYAARMTPVVLGVCFCFVFRTGTQIFTSAKSRL